MNALHERADYADTMELALYNTVLAGMSLTGKNFFYVNPLEVDPQIITVNPNYKHIKPARPPWFDCACCPANLARTIMGLGLYAYGKTLDALYVNLYCEGSAKDDGRELKISTTYPFGDTANLTVSGGKFAIYLRNPQAAPVHTVTINGQSVEFTTENGYIVLERNWQGDSIELTFDMQPRYVYCAGELQYNAGKAAVMRGPIVYCAEEIDNSALLGSYIFNDNVAISPAAMPEGLLPECVALSAPAYKLKHAPTGLYHTEKPTLESCSVQIMPYFLWAIRG